jgi:fibronectin-binding autotransporter adhesin
MRSITNRAGRSAPNRLPTFAAAGVLLLGARAASAQTWDGGGADDNFSTPLNWNPNAVPANNGTATLTFAGGVRLNPKVNVNFDVNGIVFDPTAGGFLINSVNGSALTVRGGGVTNNDADQQQIWAPTTFAANSLVNANAGNLRFFGVVGLGANTLTVGGAQEVRFDEGITGTGTIVKNGSGRLVITPIGSPDYDLTVNAGTAVFSGGPTLDAGVTYSVLGGTLDAVNGITIAGGQLTRDSDAAFLLGAGRVMRVEDGGDVTFNGSYSSAGGAALYRVTGAGSTLTSGRFFINDARLEASLGASVSLSGGLSIGNDAGRASAVIDGAGSSLTLASGPVSIGGEQGATAQLTFSNGAAGNLGAGTVSIASLGSTATLTVAGGATLTTGAISLATSANSGTGIVSVSGGGSRLTAGGINVGTSTGTATLNVEQSGTLVLTGPLAIAPAGVVNINGTLTLGAGQALINAGTLNFNSGRVELGTDLAIGGNAASPLGTDIVLPAGKSIEVPSAHTTSVGGSVVIDGGTMSTGRLVNAGGTIDFRRGTLAVTGSSGLRVTSDGPLGANVSLASGATLAVDSTTTIAPDGVVNVTGGTFRSRLTNQGTLAVLAGAAALGGDPVNEAGAQMYVAAPVTLSGFNTTLGTLTNRAGARIELAGPAGRISGPGLFTNAGLLTGHGTVAANVFNAATGEVRAEAGKTLSFTNPMGTNAGLMDLQGGTLDVTPALTNLGRITGRGSLKMRGGLTNAGQVQFSAGLTDVHGAFTQQASGKTIVSGGGTATFYDVVNIAGGSEFRVSQDSRAVFFGPVTGGGAFTGPGTKYFEAGSPALGVVQTAGSTVVEAAATVGATHFRESALTVNGRVSIAAGGGSAGTSGVDSLTLSGSPGAWRGLLDLADHALVVRAGELARVVDQVKDGFDGSGGITSSLADHRRGLGVIANGTSGVPLYAEFQGIASLAGGEVLVRYTLLGDVNLDGTVSGGDLGRVRQHLGTRGDWSAGDFDYDGRVTVRDMAMVRRNFGLSLPVQIAPAGVFAVVPEPGGLGLLAIAGIFSLRRRRCRA